jgi:hypothetical protein
MTDTEKWLNLSQLQEKEIAALKAENERLKKEKEYFYGRWRAAEETKSGLYKDIERLTEALKGGK